MTAAERFVKRAITGKREDKDEALLPENGGSAESVSDTENKPAGESAEKQFKRNRWTDSALSVALKYLEDEGDTPTPRNPFDKGWGLKKGRREDTERGEKTAQDALYEALVSDEALPVGQTLEEHDKQHHPKGYKEGDTCKFRERLAMSDEADEVDVDKGEGRQGGSGKEQKGGVKKPLVTAEEDAEYMKAVESGDMDRATEMVREAAAKAFPDTKVVDEEGKPKPVYHCTDEERITEFIVPYEGPIEWEGLPGLFFADEPRYEYGKNKISAFLNIIRPTDMNEGGADFLHGRNGKKIEDFGKQYEEAIRKHEEDFRFGEDGSLFITPKGLEGLKSDGYFGDMEEGVKEYAILSPNQVKSAESVTYYDDGSVVPLSKRFGGGEDIRFAIGKDEPFPYETEQNKEEKKPQQKTYGDIPKKKVAEYQRLMAKKHPEMDADMILTEIGKIKDRKLQGDAFAWVMRGAVRLPEDMYKVEQARELATKAKKDPLSWNTPQACINDLLGEGHKVTEKPITIEELKKNPLMSDYRNEGYGVETFEVEDSREGQALMRQVLNTHWGKDANPWCLLHGDGEGNLSDGSEGGYDAWEYWNHYNALPQRVAFKDGKLLAFMATDGEEFSPEADALREEYKQSDDYKKYDMSFENWLSNNYPDVDPIGEQWWDRQDRPHRGIPLGDIEVPNDKLHRRTADYELSGGKVTMRDGGKMYSGTAGTRGYKEWNRYGNLAHEITPDGDAIDYRETQPPVPFIVKRANGDEEKYDRNGNLTFVQKYDGNGMVSETFSWMKEGDNRFLDSHTDENKGITETWYPNGNRASYNDDDDGWTEWYPNGFIKEKSHVDYGDGSTRRYQWDEEGNLTHELYMKDGEVFPSMREPNDKDKARFKQEEPDPKALEKPAEGPKGLFK